MTPSASTRASTTGAEPLKLLRNRFAGAIMLRLSPASAGTRGCQPRFLQSQEEGP